MTPILHIGNKNYSSWSMRPWLALRWAGISFEERVIPLGGPGYSAARSPEILAVSPSGRVPALHIGGAVIYESLAICEWANERAPEAALWPGDLERRALARSVAAEMHAGFAALRRDMSMNIRRRLAAARSWPEDTHADLERLFGLWTDLRTRFRDDGPWLLGARSIADAMFAPVATRLRTYLVEAPQVAQHYCETVFADRDFQEWENSAAAETWTIAQTDRLYA
jgi:glutathione S-transferase